MTIEKTVLISSRNIPEIAGVVDQVGILAGGRLVVEEPLEALQRDDPRPLEEIFISHTGK